MSNDYDHQREQMRRLAAMAPQGEMALELFEHCFDDDNAIAQLTGMPVLLPTKETMRAARDGALLSMPNDNYDTHAERRMDLDEPNRVFKSVKTTGVHEPSCESGRVHGENCVCDRNYKEKPRTYKLDPNKTMRVTPPTAAQKKDMVTTAEYLAGLQEYWLKSGSKARLPVAVVNMIVYLKREGTK